MRIWNRQTFFLIGTYIIILLRILSGFGFFAYPGDHFLGDFSHILFYERFFITGGDYLTWNPPEEAFNAGYAPVFPGVMLFFVPLVWLGEEVSKILLIVCNIVSPLFTAYLIAKVMQLPFSWRLWSPSKGTWVALLIYILIIFSRPYMSSLIPGQFTSLIFLLILYSLIYGKGWILGCATALKFSLTIFYFPWFILSKRIKEAAKGILVLLLLMLVPIVSFLNLWTLYRDYLLKMREHFTSTTIDTLVGCKAGCWMFIEAGWFVDEKINLLIKAILFSALLYAYWKNRGNEQVSLHALMLTGAVTLLLFYHRVYDQMLVTIPLLMILIAHFKEKNWIPMAFPALMYMYYLLPSRAWHYLIGHIGPWLGKLDVYPSLKESFPLDSLAVLVLAIFAFKRIFCEQEIVQETVTK